MIISIEKERSRVSRVYVIATDLELSKPVEVVERSLKHTDEDIFEPVRKVDLVLPGTASKVEKEPLRGAINTSKTNQSLSERHKSENDHGNPLTILRNPDGSDQLLCRVCNNDSRSHQE